MTGIWFVVSVTVSTPPSGRFVKSCRCRNWSPCGRGTRPEGGQRERVLAVAPVRRPDEIEQRIVFGDREQLAVTRHPPGWCEGASEHPNLAYVR